MQIFPKKDKKAEVSYFYMTGDVAKRFGIEPLHPATLQPFTPVEQPNLGCPSASNLKDRMWEQKYPLDMYIDFNKGDNLHSPEYKYRLDPVTHGEPDEIKDRAVQNTIGIQPSLDNRIVLSLAMNLVFVTDDPTIEFVVLPPQKPAMTKECTWVTGGFHPYGWLRPFNLVWIQDKLESKSSITMKRSDPSCTLFFNKSVNLTEITPTDKILDYMDKTTHVLRWFQPIKNIYKIIGKTRPEYLLKK